ncbi:MAG: amino acid adenylation domain-containing protein [Acidobacteriota bacterium]
MSETGYPLSPTQRQLWERAGLEARTVLRLEVEGVADGDSLEGALQRMATEHEVLSSSVRQIEELGLVVETPGGAPPSITRTDISGREDEAVEEAIAAAWREESKATGDSLQVTAFERGDGRWTLVAGLPALHGDAGTAAGLAAELAAVLEGQLEGGPAEPVAGEEEEDESFQYAHYTAWLEEMLESEEGQQATDHWAAVVAQLPEAPRLPLAQRGARGEGAVITQPVSVSAEQIEAIEALVTAEEDEEGEEISAAAPWVALWTAFVARLASTRQASTRQHSARNPQPWTLGLMVDGRRFAELERMPGLLARAVPVAVPSTSAGATGESLQGAIARWAQPLEEAEEWSDGFDASAHGGATDHPLWGAVGFESVDLGEVFVGAGARVWATEVVSDVTPFALCLRRRSGDSGEGLELLADPRRWSRDAVAELAAAFATLSQNALANPAQPLDQLAVVGETQRARLVEEWARGPEGAPFEPVHRRIAAVADRMPDSVAVEAVQALEGDGEGEALSYGELQRRVQAGAARLRQQGAGGESVVAVLAQPSSFAVVAALAVLESGAACVFLDPTHPEERLAFVAQDAGAQLLIAATEAPQALAELQRVDLEGAGGNVANALASPSEVPSPESLAMVVYTSGSTGRPKGVMVPHGALDGYLQWALKTYGTPSGEEPGAVPLHGSLAFDLAFTSLFVPLLAGGTVVPVPALAGAEGLVRLLEGRGGFSFLKLTPSHLRMLTAALPEERREGAAAALVVGGEALHGADLEAWKYATVWNEYGPTETVVGCVAYAAGSSPWEGEAVPIGRSVAGARAYVLDADLQPLLPGVAGELYIGGSGVTRGYLKRPETSAERFLPDPFSGTSGDRMYRTGDVVRWLGDGTLEYVGRGDDQLKFRGLRLEPGEVEAALAAHPAVREAAVTLRGDADARRLVAFYVAEGEDLPEISELRDFLARWLPEALVPGTFVPLPELPQSAAGKVDRGSLPLLDSAVGVEYTAPRTVEEEILAASWARALGIERVGIDDDFFDLGGDSIRAIPAVSLALERGVQVELAALFAHRTVRRLAATLVEQKPATDAGPVQPFSLLSEEDRERLPEGLEDAYPLSRLQAGMIYHLAARPESGRYHDVFCYQLKVPFDASALEASVAALVARHPALRSRFDLSAYSEPLQLVDPQGPTPLEIHDARDFAADQRAAHTEQWIEQERRRGFDPAEPPLLRFAVHRWSDEEMQLTVSFHHAIIDGWSDATLLLELALDYARALRGLESEIGSPASRHSDFVALERQAIDNPEDEGYWRQHLSGAAATPLPRQRVEDAPPAEEGESGRLRSPLWQTVPVSDELSDGLEAAARRAAVPLKSLLLAAHLRALGSIAGENDVVTCITVNGRPETADGERILGLFLNSMPLRLQLEPGRWIDLARRAFEIERDALSHRRYPLIEIEREITGTSLAETSFYFTNYHLVGGLDVFPELEVKDIIFHEATSFPLVANFHLDAFTRQVRVELTFDRDLFGPRQAKRAGEIYSRVLEAIVADPEARHEALPSLDESAQQQVLVASGAASAATSESGSPASEALFPTRFFAHAASSPEAVALRTEAGEWSYGQLARRAAGLASRLRDAGAAAETVVAIDLPRSPEAVVALLAVLATGAAYLPLERRHPQRRRAALVADAGAVAVISDGASEAVSSGVEIINLREVGEAQAPPLTDLSPEGLAYVLYTSGSTGVPKGVEISHGALAAYLARAHELYGPDGAPVNTVLATSLAFDLTVTSLLLPLASGGSAYLAADGEGIEPLAEAVRAAGRGGVLKLTPSHARLLAGRIDAAAGPDALVLGGEALHGGDLEIWRREAPATRVFNEYGPTEATVGCVVYGAEAGEIADGAVSIGQPMAGMRALVVDRFGHLAPSESPGELWLGGAALARGYRGDPARTAATFLPDPWSQEPGARLYRTGDRVRRDAEGELWFLGRLDRQVKVGGVRIEPGEVEATLRRHPEIRHAAVVAREDEGGEARLVAYAVPEQGVLPSLESLRRYLSERLPEAMVPAVVVPLDTLPLTPHGKLDAAALPSPEGARLGLRTPFVAPRSEAEEVLAAIWGTVLGVDRVGIDDDYFALGGDSIRSLQVVARARQRGLVFPMETLFEHRSVRRLAASLEEAEITAAAIPDVAPFALVPEEDRDQLPEGLEDAYPLARLQAGMLYHREIAPGSGVYHDVIQFHLRAPYDGEALRLAAKAVLSRHPALRSTFHQRNLSEPLVFVHRSPVVELTEMDLRNVDPQEGERLAAVWVLGERQRGFDPEELPLVRYGVHRHGDGSFHFSISFHHAIIDGWSDASMLTELALTYRGFLEQDPYEPEPLTSQFRHFVALERQALEEADFRDFWSSRLDGAEPFRLPPVIGWEGQGGDAVIDRGDRGLDTPEGVLDLPVKLPMELCVALHDLARDAAVPLKSVLLTGHLRVLSLLSGQDEVVTTLTSSGRPETADGQRVLGLFINSLPMRFQVGSESWRALAQEVFAAERETLPRRRFPFAESRQFFGGERPSEVSFYFTHYHIFRHLQRFEELEVLGVRAHEQTSFPLVANFHLDPESPEVEFHLSCDPQRLDRSAAYRLAELYRRVFETMVAAPQDPPQSAELLSAAEREELQASSIGASTEDSSADSSSSAPADVSWDLAEQMESTWAAHGAEDALLWSDGSWSHQRLGTEVRARVAQLRQRGVGPESVVALDLQRSPELVAWMLAVVAAGGAYLPLMPDHPRTRRVQLLHDAGARWVVAPAQAWKGGSIGEVLPSAVERLEPQVGDLESFAEAEPLPTVSSEALAYVLYTSGSTGRPKGVMVSREALGRYLARAAASYGAGGTWLLHTPLVYDLAITGLWLPLLSGGRVVLAPEPLPTMGLAPLVPAGEERPKVKLTPSQARLLGETLTGPAGSGELPEPLHWELVLGGEALSPSDVAWLPSGSRVHDEYGPTEAVVGCTVSSSTVSSAMVPSSAEESAFDEEGRVLGSSGIGVPMPDCSAWVVDDGLVRLPLGVPGELALGGGGLARGYLGQPRETAQRFVPDPYSGEAGARLYRTGDRARWRAESAGQWRLEYLGRGDSQLKVRGIRVEPGEVESTLAALTTVRAAVVEGWSAGGAPATLAAWVVPSTAQRAEDRELFAEALREELIQRLPEAMVPTQWVVLDELPTTEAGKVDRRALPEPGSEAGSVGAFEPPQGELEELLAGLWEEVLERGPVGRSNTFVELGGHSLSATRLVLRIRRQLGTEALGLRDLYDHPTVADLARHLETLNVGTLAMAESAGPREMGEL